MHCAHVFKSGKRKGNKCEKETDGSTYCSKHAPNIVANTSQFLETIDLLQYKMLSLETTKENTSIIMKRFRYLETLPPTSTEYQKNLNWLRYALNFPYNKMVKIPVSIKPNETNDKDVSLYVANVYNKLNDYIYGMDSVKEEIMSYVCKRISNPDSNDHVLALQGSNGCGKTRLAHGLATALNLPIRTINLGSVTEPSIFTGHHLTFVDAEAGRPVQILNETQCKNCIIYFDELDKIHQTDKGQAIWSYLTHLIDPIQNHKYQDAFLAGLELDMSKVFFVFSFNDERLLDATVKDRLKIIKIKEPSKQDKLQIAQKFIIPEICKNINYNVELDTNIVDKIIQQDKSKSGLRGIKRVLEDVIGKLNLMRMLDDQFSAKLSFWEKTPRQIIDKIIDRHSADEMASFAGIYS